MKLTILFIFIVCVVFYIEFIFFYKIHDINKNKTFLTNVVKIVRPNFFILGTRKGGTTSLYTYLTKHPRVHALNIRGKPTDGEVFSNMNNLNDYKRNFKNARASDLVGDSNVARLLDNVERLEPYAHNSKFIVLLRDPIDRCHSQMLMRMRLFPKRYEKMSMNLTASLEKERKVLLSKYKPEMLEIDFPPQLFKSTKNCWYEGAYYFHLKRLFRYIPQSDVHIVLSEDFYRYTQQTVYNVMEFLGLDTDEVDPSVFNEIFNQKPREIHKNHTISDKLREEMEDFYTPLNRKLKKLLNKKTDWIYK